VTTFRTVLRSVAGHMRDTCAPRLLVVRQSELSWNWQFDRHERKDLLSTAMDAGSLSLSILDDAPQPEMCPYAPSRPRIPLMSSAPAALPTHETDVAPWHLTGLATAGPASTEASRAPAREAGKTDEAFERN
jgi:hypothetical protein